MDLYDRKLTEEQFLARSKTGWKDQYRLVPNYYSATPFRNGIM